jgi:hypothetical protein
MLLDDFDKYKQRSLFDYNIYKGQKTSTDQAFVGCGLVFSCFANFFLTLLDLTDVCSLLTKQYIQVGLQIQYMLYNF